MSPRTDRRALALTVVVALLAVAGCKRGARFAEGYSSEREDLDAGTLVFEDDFERDDIGDDWSHEGANWRIEDGWVAIEGARNDALWLDRPLPDAVRIDFDAKALSEEGDIKFEIFGDGATHESGYIGIFGGWDNQLNIIARLDEHGDDRLVGADGEHVVVDRVYHMSVVRTDGRVRWYVDGEEFLVYDDEAPLRGDGHRHFAFNDWDAPVRFDNVQVYDLGG